MPCWTVKRIPQKTVTIQTENRQVLLTAISTLGWTAEITRTGLKIWAGYELLEIMGDSIVFDGGQEALVQKLRMTYGQEAVRLAAKANGWDEMRFSFNSDGELEGELVRESL